MEHLRPADFFRAFNAATEDFLKDLRLAFPKNKELRTLQAAHEMAQGSSLRLPLETFARVVVAPYGDRLRAKDEGFFLAHDYREDCREGGAAAEDVVATVKGLWGTMTPGHRDAALAHIDRLLSVHDAAVAVVGAL